MDSHISQYREQVRLLINSLPQVAKEKCFALKGGTAINLFVMDFPRLSVDIDLAYVPVSDRTTDLKAISEALDRIVTDLNTKAGIRAEKLRGQGEEIRIHVYSRETMIKIEVNHVWRGLLINPSELEVSERVEDEFGFAAINVVSRPDLMVGRSALLWIDNIRATFLISKCLWILLVSHRIFITDFWRICWGIIVLWLICSIQTGKTIQRSSKPSFRV